jgi:hypothetical protein
MTRERFYAQDDGFLLGWSIRQSADERIVELPAHATADGGGRKLQGLNRKEARRLQEAMNYAFTAGADPTRQTG